MSLWAKVGKRGDGCGRCGIDGFWWGFGGKCLLKGDSTELTNCGEEGAERLPLLVRVFRMKEGYRRRPGGDEGVLSDCVVVIYFGHILCYGSVSLL